jgi:hypothetical protein
VSCAGCVDAHRITVPESGRAWVVVMSERQQELLSLASYFIR